MHTGEKIKKIRLLKGLTQEDLAIQINKTRSMVSSIEQTGKVNHYTLLAILKALGITETDLELFDGKSVSGGSHKNSELLILKEKLENALKEIETLKELVKSQKKLIAFLEKR